MTEGYDFKRTHERKNYTAEVLFSHNERMYSGTVRNISLGGVFIETAETGRFALGDTVVLSIPFTDGGKHIKREGRIKWKAHHGFAVAFS
jgi:Tfp pilus assembly protein PilZ